MQIFVETSTQHDNDDLAVECKSSSRRRPRSLHQGIDHGALLPGGIQTPVKTPTQHDDDNLAVECKSSSRHRTSQHSDRDLTMERESSSRSRLSYTTTLGRHGRLPCGMRTFAKIMTLSPEDMQIFVNLIPTSTLQAAPWALLVVRLKLWPDWPPTLRICLM
jgi:hypothetical protein